MNGTYDILISIFGDRSSSMMALMVFLAAAVLAFGIMAAAHSRSSVKRRAAGIAEYSGERERGQEIVARLQRAGGSAPARLHHQALFAPIRAAATPRSCGAG